MSSNEKASRDQLEKLFFCWVFFSPPELGSLALRINISHLASIFAARHSLTKLENRTSSFQFIYLRSVAAIDLTKCPSITGANTNPKQTIRPVDHPIHSSNPNFDPRDRPIQSQ